MPAFVEDFAIAEILNVPVTQVASLDAYWLVAARAMLIARHLDQERRESERR